MSKGPGFWPARFLTPLRNRSPFDRVFCTDHPCCLLLPPQKQRQDPGGDAQPSCRNELMFKHAVLLSAGHLQPFWIDKLVAPCCFSLARFSAFVYPIRERIAERGVSLGALTLGCHCRSLGICKTVVIMAPFTTGILDCLHSPLVFWFYGVSPKRYILRDFVRTWTWTLQHASLFEMGYRTPTSLWLLVRR